MITEKQIQLGKEVLMKYTLPDALKSQYDGMTAYELVKMILSVSEEERLRSEIKEDKADYNSDGSIRTEKDELRQRYGI